MSGTHSTPRVPEWHVHGVKRAKNDCIWHVFIKLREIYACQMWHTKLSGEVIFEKSRNLYNTMINHQLRSCNQRCEVCDKSNDIKTKHQKQIDTQNNRNRTRVIEFLKKAMQFLPKKLDRNYLKH